MLRLFLDVLKKVMRLPGGRVAAAFEWPRGAIGWTLEMCRELERYLPYTCRFDGCCYGLACKDDYVLQEAVASPDQLSGAG